MLFKAITLSAISSLAIAHAQDTDMSSTMEADVPALEAPEVETTEVQTIAKEDLAVIAQTEITAGDLDADEALTQDEFLASAAVAETTSPDMMAEAGEAEVTTDDVSASAYLIAKFDQISGGDGSLTADELETALSDDFAQADMDGNAVLEGEEVNVFAALRAGKPAL
ncbi:hypothetical protein [Parvularcula sp. LCG005]|uniref:hypothetical protein n=1 Tax=Parvularcula sp. LCG005 TaxID=3078805 RepID=UPI00294237D9|nr:hypothetical protein [Parvularcula sp. LCG005]WOI54351.1 hypothetical protein RUI03_04955 [Parvularcula sp. LCG005]